MKMTKDLLKNKEQIMKDARTLKEIGAIYDTGKTRSFDEFFVKSYELEMEENLFGSFLTDEQQEIYNEYTLLVGKELYKLNHPELMASGLFDEVLDEV